MTESVKQHLSRQQLSLAYGGYSTRGVKEENEDAFAVLEPSDSEHLTKGAFVAIADGVSSASHGKEAAQMAVTMATQEYLATPESWSTQKSLAKVLSSLNRWLCGQANQSTVLNQHRHSALHSIQQWLTTLSGVIFKSATATIFHVGDTRIYKLSRNANTQTTSFEQLTRDHISNISSSRQVLTRALGAEQLVKIDTMAIPLEQGDIYLLCSDGLSSFISDNTLHEALGNLPQSPTQQALENCAKSLCKQALTNNSDDNISCLVVAVNQVATKNLDELTKQLHHRRIPPVMVPGQHLDNYKILHVLHESPRSHLYQVEDIETKEVRVLKAPSINFTDDQSYLQGFINESWVGARLNHDNVMRVFPQEYQSQYLYHTAEFIDGQSLSQWIIDNPKPSLGEVRYIIGQLIWALRAFQRMDLLHRDVKPENVILTSNKQIKLIDYGTVAIPALSENHHYISEDTPQGATRYMAPETSTNNHYDLCSELFSLGVTCYELLSGQVPYKAQEEEKLFKNHKSGWLYRPIRQLRPDLPLWIELALEKACHPQASQRYTSYSEFWQDLNQPNHQNLKQLKSQPLLTRNPVKFWQGLSIVLAFALVLALLN